jgi:hypothetical protein
LTTVPGGFPVHLENDLSNANNTETLASAAAQCAAFKEGIANFRAFVAKHQFEARNEHGQAVPCLASKTVLLMLNCIEADAADAADRATQGATA